MTLFFPVFTSSRNLQQGHSWVSAQSYLTSKLSNFFTARQFDLLLPSRTVAT